MSTHPFITAAPTDLTGWVGLFDVDHLPMLCATAQTLSDLRQNEDAVDAHRLADAVCDDPLLVLRLLAHVARLRRQRTRREGSDTETVTAALVMLGIPPFFAAFGDASTVQSLLAGSPCDVAVDGFMQVLQRSRRAARFAMAFAVHRMDSDAEVIHEAALLHDFAELLLWVRAPTLAEALRQRQAADPNLRSAAVQQDLLHIELPVLAQALMRAWHLPCLLARITDDQAHPVTPQMRNVRLAIRVARHSANGFDNPALPDDLDELAQLLNLNVDATRRLVLQVDDG